MTWFQVGISLSTYVPRLAQLLSPPIITMTTAPSFVLPKPGDTLAGKYRLISKIGEGGYGIVFRAVHSMMGRHVAIKMMRPDIEQPDDVIERYRREAYYASSLSHPNTITLYDYGRTPEGLFYIVMEYLKGVNLGQWLSLHGAMSPPETADMMEQIMRSLKEAHAQGIVHRDLKPENIYIQEVSEDEHRIKVLDFGLSKATGSRRHELRTVTREGKAYGTPQYMSPEQAVAAPVSSASDMYALGLLGYEMLVGQPAFNGNSVMQMLLKQVNDPLPPLPESVAQEPLGRFILRCTQKHAKDRFADASEGLHWWIRNGLNESYGADRDNRVRRGTSIEVSTSMGADTSSAQAWFHSKDTGSITLEEVAQRLEHLPLIGRRRELDALLRWTEHAIWTGGRMTIVGDRGIGKTRLLQEWRRQLMNQDMLILECELGDSEQYLQGLRRMFESLWSEGSTLLKDPTMRPLIYALRNACDDVLKPIGETVSCAWTLLRALGDTRPVLLIIDNAHTATEVAHAFNDAIIKLQEETVSPILVAYAAQYETKRHALSQRMVRHKIVPHNHTIDIEPLDEGEALEFVRDIIPLSDESALRVVRTARGNPSTMVSILKHMAQNQLLVPLTEGGWALPDDVANIHMLPDTLKQELMSQIRGQIEGHKLTGVINALLLRLLILGTHVQIRHIKLLLNQENRADLLMYFDESVDAMIAMGMLSPGLDAGHLNLHFNYGMLRLALLEEYEWDEPQITTLHHMAADIKLDRLKRLPEEAFSRIQLQEDIGLHHVAEGHVEEGLQWLLRAADSAFVIQEHRLSMALLQHIASLINAQVDPDGETLMQVRLREGRVYERLGNMEHAERALREALEETERVGDVVGQSICEEALASVLTVSTNYEAAAGLYHKVWRFHEQYQDPRGILRCMVGSAHLLYLQGKYVQANALFDDALVQARHLNHEAMIVQSVLGLGRCAYTQGNVSEAIQHLKQVRKIAQQRADVTVTVEADLELSLVAAHIDHIERASALARRALRAAQSMGDVLSMARAHLGMGLCLRYTLKLDDGLEHAQKSRKLYASVSHIHGVAKAVLLESEVLFHMGRIDSSLEMGQRALQLHKEINDVHGMTLSLLHLGLVQLQTGDVDKSERYLSRAQRLIHMHGLSFYQPQLVFAQARNSEVKGDIEDAVAEMDEALRLGAEHGRLDIQALAGISLSGLHLLMGDLNTARSEAQIGMDHAERLGRVPQLLFCVLMTAIIAHIDQNMTAYHSAMRRLHTLTAPSVLLDMRVPHRLALIAELIQSRPRQGRSADGPAVGH